MVTPAQPSRRFLAPGDKLGKHEIIRQIAVGGMAELYLTRTVGIEGFEKLVCVKRILPQYIDNPSFVNMFLNEARLAATLHHPNIAQVYDIGQEQGEFFFSMEYVHGEDLGRLVATARENRVAISLDCVLTLVAGLCAGLHHAHEKTAPDGKPLGVVHRDVSPTNVLVSYDGAIKLVDFGIARAAGRPSSQTGLKGKISYMSPEQCRGKSALDRRSDVFSVGAILFELTTGRLPFVDETEYGVLHQIVNRDAEPPSTIVPGYPAALEAIVMRALARDPARRFSTALELQNQLEDFAHDNRLRVSPLVLARLMSTLFPARLEEWDHARAQGAFFVEQHVVRTLIESGKATGRSEYQPQPLSPIDDATGEPTALSADPDELERTIPSPHGAGHPAPPRMPTPHPVSMPGARVPTPHPVGPSLPSLPPIPPVGMSAPPMPTAPMVAQAMGMPAPSMTMPPMGMLSPVPISQPMGTLPPMPPAQAMGMPASPLPTQSPSGPPSPLPPSASMTSPGTSRPIPVPNMPGAVPIVPLTAPPVPSGGTLVSSATQAGTQPPPVAPSPVPYPSTSAFASPVPGHYPGLGPGLSGPTSPDGLAGLAPHTARGSYPGGGPNPAEEPTFPVRGAGRPTLVLRRRRSRLPVAAVAIVGAAGALVGVLLAVTGDDASTSSRRGPPPAASDNAPAPTAPPAPDPTRAAGAPSVAEPAQPADTTANDKAATAAAKAAEPTDQAAVQPETVASPDDADAKKKLAKPARPKVRAEPKRTDVKRGSKADAKEQTWNADSPFMPVVTPKR